MGDEMDTTETPTKDNNNGATVDVRFPYTLHLIKADHPKLQEINLSGQYLNSAEVNAFADSLQHNRHLMRLNLSYNNVDDKAVEALSKCGSLQELYLDANGLADHHAKQLAKHETIVSLSLSRNNIGMHGHFRQSSISNQRKTNISNPDYFRVIQSTKEQCKRHVDADISYRCKLH